MERLKSLFPILAVAAIWAYGCDGPTAPGSDTTGVQPAVEPASLSEVTVVGTGNAAVDVPAVQNAVDAYDKVFLQGTFDFGQPVFNGPNWWDWDYSQCESVLISRAVELVGEVERHGNQVTGWHTTIMGGLEPIKIVNSTSGKVAISGIDFDGAAGTAVVYLKGQDLEISEVRIINVTPGPIYEGSYFGRLGISVWDWPIPQYVGGKVSIHHSVLDVSEHYAYYSRAIVVGGGDADVDITDNYIKCTNGWNTIGVEVFQGSRTATMERNHVIAGRYLLMSFGNYGPIYMRRNTGEMVSGERNQGAVLLGTYSDDGGVVAHNQFRLAGTDVGIWVGSEPYSIGYRNGVIRNNQLTGEIVSCGICFWHEGHDNAIVGNNLTNLVYADGTKALTYYLAPTTSGNVVKGHTGGGDYVLDLGTDNYLTGVTPMAGAGGIGKQVSSNDEGLP